MLFAPPGSAKSTYLSVLFPPWYLARYPGHDILAATHSVEFAERWGRRIRNDIAEHSHVLGIELSGDNKAAARWGLTSGAEYYGVGAGTGISGFRADLGLGDDFFGNREDAYSETVRAKRWDWYIDDFSARLKPGAKRILINCLAGDTLIAMADGAQKRFDEVVPGDLVRSWDGRKTVSAEVSAVVDNGIDQTYLIRTNRAAVRANARHPFLILTNKGLRWTATKNLRNGMRIVVHRTARMQERPVQSVAATNLLNAGACARVTTIRQCGRLVIAHLLWQAHIAFQRAADGAMELIRPSSIKCWPSRMAFVPFAAPMAVMAGPGIGLPISSQIITTRRECFAACSAMTATGLPDEPEIPQFWNVPSNTSEPDTDTIVAVDPYGLEPVYDLTIEGTHNFVANGMWTHNTRWHEEDVAGRILEQIDKGIVSGRVISIPAVAEENDALGRKPGEYLWDNPDGYNYGSFLRARQRETSPMMWSALYQQRPAPEEGDYFKAEWLRSYDKAPAKDMLKVYGASDYAVTADGGDYTVHVVVGVDSEQRMYLLDVWRKQAASDEWVESFCDLVLEWRPMEWAEEQGQIKSGVGPFLAKRQQERKAYVYRRQYPTRGDKAVRAQSIRGRMAMNGLYCPSSAQWVAQVRSELLSFPAGKYDDICDAMGLIGQLLDHIQGVGKKEPKPISPHVFAVAEDGRMKSNLSVQELIERQRKRRQVDD